MMKTHQDELLTKSVSSTTDTQAISLANTKRVHITVRDLSIKAKRNSIKSIFKRKRQQGQHGSNGDVLDEENQAVEENMKTVLHPTSFDIKAGTVTAIMGGSGSSKTTLLNSLSHRFANSSNLIRDGNVYFNGNEDINSIRHAYVIQEDVLLPQLTCYETLLFAAELRLPKLTNKAERQNLVGQIILELGLKDCKNTIVGDGHHKGLSGGEKRRLSIGIQMLSNPSVLFLDEPTTGLDAFNAHLLIKTLKNLAKSGKSFIVSIHQPRSDIFFLFDNVILLSSGRLCYGYSGDKMLSYFNRIGYQCPDHINPADFFIDISSLDTRTEENEQISSKNLNRITSGWKTELPKILMTEEETTSEITHNEQISVDLTLLDNSVKAPFLRELKILIRRNFLLSLRDAPTMAALFLEPIVMGLICGWVFFKPGDSYVGAKTIQGVLYTSNGLQGYMFILFEIYRLSMVDIKVFDLERLEGCVSVPGFLLARRASKFFIEDIPIPFLFSVIIYFMVGLRTDSASHYFIFLAGSILNHLITISFGTLCIAISRDFAIASLYGNLYYTFVSMASGYFVNAKTMPVYVRWTKYLAGLWYGFGMFASNEFTDYKGECFREYAGDPNVDTICVLQSGENILETLGYSENWITTPMCAELAMAVGLYIVAGIIFHFKVIDISLAKQIHSSQKKSKDVVETTQQVEMKDIMKQQQLTKKTGEDEANEPSIDVFLQNVYLNVTVQNFWRKFTGQQQIKDKIILNNIDAIFEHGKLNAIMGPSGSGKSSLLNFISGRISSSLSAKYAMAGHIYLDKYQVTPDLMRSVCCYVSQDDNNLLPTLTVRETIRFAAKLRLPTTVSDSKREEIVEDIIMKMGLRDCQNTPIGSQLKKGISGGEKRRVSISVQLVNNPKILLLDEPTSGLDAFTASSILTVLKKLSDEGKTVIMTIHQPRSDLFQQFGSVLLLAKGGEVAFNGSTEEMAQYFSSLGHTVPKLTNPADHMLDLISVNTQNLQAEMESRSRVEFFIENWKQQKKKTQLVSSSSDIILDKTSTAKIFSSIVRKPASFKTAFPLLCQRQWLGVVRDRDVVINRLTQVAGMGIILALFFAPLKNNYVGVNNRMMLIQQSVTPLYFVGMLNNLCLYPRERAYFYEEFHDNVVGLSSFFWAYFVIELPFEIFSSILFAALIVMVIGLPRTPELFFAMAYIALCVVNCGESLGITFNTFFNHVGFAMNIVSLVLSISTFMAGLMSLEMSGFLKAINWTSPLHYGVMAATNMSFRKEDKFTCDESEMDSNGDCVFSDGQDVLDTYGINYDYKMLLGVLIAIVIGYRCVTYMVIKFKLLKLDVSKFKPNNRN